MKIRRLLFTTFFSISICQYYIVPHRPISDLLKWQEIYNDHILFNKLGPIVNTDLRSSKIISFYYTERKSSGILKGEIIPEISINNIDGTRLRIYGTAGINFNEQLSIQNYFEFDNKGKNDLHFQGVERGLKNGWVGYLQHSSMTYNYLQGHFSIGRGNPYFFNMTESLLLNPNFPPAEYAWWQHEIQWFQYDWGTILLNKVDILNRFLTFHRYGIKNKNWRFGFTEAVMGTYETWGSPEIGYILPAAVHLETEENRGINANLMWLIDGMVKLNSLTLYSEFLIDDFALDGLSPPQIAGMIGLGKTLKGTLLNIEYIKINRWTGNYCDTTHINTWIESKVPIGHSMGSDAQRLLIKSYYAFSEELAIELSFSWNKSGIGTAIERLEEWPNGVECETNFGYRVDPSPTEKYITYTAAGNLYYLFNENILIKLSMDFSDIKTQSEIIVSYRYK